MTCAPIAPQREPARRTPRPKEPVMTLNLAHLHLLLNHFPIIGTIFGLSLFLVSFFGKNQDLRRASYIIFAGVGLLAIPTFLTGIGAQAMLSGQPAISDALIQR